MIPRSSAAEASHQRPCLRPLEILPTEVDGEQMYCLRDHLEPDAALLVSRAAVLLLSLMDGERDLRQISAAFELRTGQALPPGQIEVYVRQLDEAYLLEGGRFAARLAELRAAYQAAPYREAIHAGGAYAGEPTALRA